MKVFQQYPLPVLIIVTCCLFSCCAFSQNNYRLVIHFADKDSSLSGSDHTNRIRLLDIRTAFHGRGESLDYIKKLPGTLASKGYAASIDSIYSDTAATHIILYVGEQYQWAEINTDSIDPQALKETGWNEKMFNNYQINFEQLQQQQRKILEYYENSGYPFASVRLDSITMDAEKIRARLMAEKGPSYVIDSIRVYGKIKIRNFFLQRYLGIENGSIYDKSKLENISSKLLQLPYLQEQQHWDLTMLGSGSVLNLYLQQKRSSQVNFLVGFLPSNTQTGKLLITADVDLNLKNTLGAGETIVVNWQQLQRQSPRLNLGYQHPFIFKSRFGTDFTFDLLKRDSSFLQINGQAGLLYVLSANQSGKIFFQNQRTYLLSGGFDTNQVKITKKLPVNIDVNSNSLGINYEWLNTNYIFNPRKGNELKLTAAAGIKRISKNSEIANLKDPSNPGYNFNSLYDSFKLNTYQFRINFTVARYFPAGKKSTLKTGVNGGIFHSENIFRNELFQIGGYNLLRGFNEESIYASRYAVVTAEYRYLTGLNSFLFLFTDAGFTKTQFQDTRFSNNFFSTGLGLSLETGFGILNVSYAIGKRDDIKFDIRDASKIHFGYINYF